MQIQDQFQIFAIGFVIVTQQHAFHNPNSCIAHINSASTAASARQVQQGEMQLCNHYCDGRQCA